ncbi:MAG: hypothetical protein BWY72_00625 [Bacteroidetes bacterium ADurb.Bin416]|nr:MAG: hypothetical protein BWY72_00625 [Bacteroidetes bacterium ADurb.Bin416]
MGVHLEVVIHMQRTLHLDLQGIKCHTDHHGQDKEQGKEEKGFTWHSDQHDKGFITDSAEHGGNKSPKTDGSVRPKTDNSKTAETTRNQTEQRGYQHLKGFTVLEPVHPGPLRKHVDQLDKQHDDHHKTSDHQGVSQDINQQVTHENVV